LHRLLEFDPRAAEFQRRKENPLDVHAVILDEASMIDSELMRSLLAALPDTARLVIVGDSDQLPSVGPGAVLRDLIASRVVPTVRLLRIFRQGDASGIVENAHRILRGEAPQSARPDDPSGDFFIVTRKTPEDAAEVVRELVTSRIPRRFGLDPQRDVQVLTPMHRGPAGTMALNELLQQALNPLGPALEVRGQKLRPGDKVLQMRNDYENEVFNGDVGVVASVSGEERSLRVRFEGGDVEYDHGSLDALTLAYAMSVHKSQGSEYPAVVLPLLTTHFVMLTRNLLYTAVTRARNLCVLIADPRALHLALSDARREDRRTRLAERLVAP
jgi:exodeoxyribonuclease V alpha subunit